jgi:hypothetical protein
MKGGRSLAAVTGRHFQAFRKSQRTTTAVLCEGLAAVGRLGLTHIAGAMAAATTVRRRITRR